MSSPDEFLASLVGFEWDAANATKSLERHRVTRAEAEEVFLHRPVVLAQDEKHSQSESRFSVLGRSAQGRLLAVIFTVRSHHIRVISARPMSRKERTHYASLPPEAP